MLLEKTLHKSLRLFFIRKYLVPNRMHGSFINAFTSEELGCPAYDMVFFFNRGENDSQLWPQLCREIAKKEGYIWSNQNDSEEDSENNSGRFYAYILKKEIEGKEKNVLFIILVD